MRLDLRDLYHIFSWPDMKKWLLILLKKQLKFRRAVGPNYYSLPYEIHCGAAGMGRVVEIQVWDEWCHMTCRDLEGESRFCGQMSCAAAAMQAVGDPARDGLVVHHGSGRQKIAGIHADPGALEGISGAPLIAIARGSGFSNNLRGSLTSETG